jgi:hypothetical protein
MELDAAVRAESARRPRRSFLVAAAAAAGWYGFYRWIDRSPGDQLIPRPLRRMPDFNAKVSRGVFDERGLAPTYPVSKSMELRTNGNYGLKMDLVPDSYRLQMVGVENAKRFPQYVDDVTAWEYQYAAKKEPGPVEHDTKVAPKDEAKVDSNSDAGAGEGSPSCSEPRYFDFVPIAENNLPTHLSVPVPAFLSLYASRPLYSASEPLYLLPADLSMLFPNPIGTCLVHSRAPFLPANLSNSFWVTRKPQKNR